MAPGTALPIPATLVEYRRVVVCEKGKAVNDRRFGSVALCESIRVTDVGRDSQPPGQQAFVGTVQEANEEYGDTVLPPHVHARVAVEGGN